MALGAAVLLVIAACGEGGSSGSPSPHDPGSDATTTTRLPAGSPPASPAPELRGTTWKVTLYRAPAAFTNPRPDGPVTLRFEPGGTVSGSSGCNHYRTDFVVEGAHTDPADGLGRYEQGQAIRFGSISVTEIACENQSVMEQETEYLPLLSRVRRWVIDDDKLILSMAVV